MNSPLINAGNWEDATVEIARTVFRPSWELSIATDDEELFDKVWKEAERLVVSDLVVALIESGQFEVAGMSEQGDMMYSLKKTARSSFDII